MAVLSAVIERGTKASRPAAAKEGYLYFATDEGILYRDSGSAWESYSASGLVFEFSTTTSDADPGVGHIRFNNATPANVTTIFIDDQALNSDADLGTVWDAIADARILITQVDDPAKYLLAEVTADTDGTGYWKLTVTVDDSGTLPDDGALLSVHVLGGGGGSGSGSGSTLWWDDDKANVISYQVFHDGDIAADIGQAANLESGTGDGDGATGAGGFTETQVACSCFFDTSPSTASRGISIFDQDIECGVGFYMRTSVRFAEDNDQNLYVALCESSPVNDSGVLSGNEFIGLIKRSTDTNWQVAHNDGSTGATYVDTGVAWGAGDWLNIEIYLWDTGGGTMNAKVWINGTLEATIVSNLPSAGTKTVRPHIESYFLSTGDAGTYDQVFFCNHVKWVAQDEEVLSNNGWATSLS